MVLAKSAFVAVPPPLAKMPPNIPLHCIAVHLFHDFGRTALCRTRRLVAPEESQVDAASGLIRDECRVLMTAVTYRFERRFSTSVLVTRGSRWVMQRSQAKPANRPEPAVAANALRMVFRARGADAQRQRGRIPDLRRR